MPELEMDRETRLRHIYVSGKSGFGKSTLLFWLAYFDMLDNWGLTIIDPKGDLVDQVINYVPEHRLDDVIYFDCRQEIPLDFMHWETDEERGMLAGDLITILDQFSGQADVEGRWKDVLMWTILAILEARGSFLDIYDFLTDEDFRDEKILKRVKDPRILKYWDKKYNKNPKDAALPILWRMGKTITSKPISTILGSAEAKLNIAEVIEKNQILLVNTKKVGRQNGDLIGSLFVSQIQQAIFKRHSILPPDRVPYYLFVDEFQHFKTTAFNEIMKEARGFKLGLTIANLHPGRSQISGEMIDDIKGCITTYILYRMAEEHARIFKSEIRPIEPEQLPDLPEFTAVFSQGRGELIDTWEYPAPPTAKQLENAKYIRKRTLEKYTCEIPKKPHTKSKVSSDGDIAPYKEKPNVPPQGETPEPRTNKRAPDSR